MPSHLWSSRALLCVALCLSVSSLSACVLTATPDSAATPGGGDMAADQGGTSDMGSADLGPSDLGGDMPPDEDMATCHDACEEDAQECAEAHTRRTCARGEQGCLVWTVQPCSDGEVCEEDGDQAACHSVSTCDAEAECDPAQYPTCQGARRTTCILDNSSGCYTLVSEDCPTDATCSADTKACECADEFPRCEAGALKCSAVGRPQVCKIAAGATCPRWQNQLACDATQDEVCQDGRCVSKSDVCTSNCINAQLGKGRCAAGPNNDPGYYEICERQADPSCLRWTLKSCVTSSGVGTEEKTVRACASHNTAIACTRDASAMTFVCEEVQCAATCLDTTGQAVCAR